ncbi:uncharacterized protein [Setaria viridis]|uniref:uncharacterized protein n=1 Tax=Setaria viridis TaxID=4556 RepID=UPI003B3BD3CB
MDYFSELVGWWEESQLRFLVLCSLFLQYFLFISAILRKYNIPSWLRFFTWLAYIGGDAIAIYALATLFNRHKEGCAPQIAKDKSSSRIEVVWAPILLMHLGGQDGITAYNIEDNELWRRHVLTALSQVTVAIYVFWKSWTSPSEETILWKTTLLVFAPEILKCFEKPWALKNASITSLTSMWRPVENGEINTLEAFVEAACHLWWDNQPNNEGPPLEPNNEGPPLEPNNEGPPLEPNNNEGPPLEPNNNEGPPLEPNNEGPPLEPNNNEGPPLEPNNEGPPLQPNDEERKPYTLFVDIVYSYDDRLRNLSYILRNTDDEVYGLVQSGLSSTFDRL